MRMIPKLEAWLTGLTLAASLMVLGCGDGATTDVIDDAVAVVSEGRLNAAKAITTGSSVVVDILQRDRLATNQDANWPLGDGTTSKVRWTSVFGGPVTLTPSFTQFQYDLIVSKGETDYIVGINIPTPAADPNLTQVDFSFAAVNPYVTGHVRGNGYTGVEAMFPSNDDTVANRSLFDLNGGEVAIVVYGLKFASTTYSEASWWGVDSNAWLMYMRDNAYPSGKFLFLAGAIGNGPSADDDPSNPYDSLRTPSAQVNGIYVSTGMLIPPTGTVAMTTWPYVNVNATPYGYATPYVVADLSNVDATGAVSQGAGGFVLVTRPTAWGQGAISAGPAGEGLVVLDPANFSMNSLSMNTVGYIPFSGYNEMKYSLIDGGTHETNNAGTSATANKGGVHCIGVSMLFQHAQP